MTDISNWFKTIFILEITGELAVKMVPERYKESITFIMKLVLVMAMIVPILNIKNVDISEITESLRSGFEAYSKENAIQTIYDTADKKAARELVQSDIAETVKEYGFVAESVSCSFTSDMTAIDKINVYVKASGDADLSGLKAYIADRYNISEESIYIEP